MYGKRQHPPTRQFDRGDHRVMILFTDASVKSHAGVGIGWHIQTWSDNQNSLLKTVDKGNDYLSDRYTSEEAELLAMTRGIKEALRMGERDYLRIRSDCKPLVEKVKNHTYITDDGSYMKSLYALLDYVDNWKVKWTPREKNSCADRQAHVALDQYA